MAVVVLPQQGLSSGLATIKWGEGCSFFGWGSGLGSCSRSWAGGQSDQMVAQFPGVSIHLQEPWAKYVQILLSHEREASNIWTD